MTAGSYEFSLKWPRAIESDPRRPQLEEILSRDPVRLWEGGTIPVPSALPTPLLEKTLQTLQGRQQLERGLERIGEILSTEKRGLDALNEKLDQSPALRISRLLLIADGGSERFYRGCERLLHEHSDRLFALRLETANSELIDTLYGEGALAKVLLISHRDAVTETLWSFLS